MQVEQYNEFLCIYYPVLSNIYIPILLQIYFSKKEILQIELSLPIYPSPFVSLVSSKE